MNDHQKTKAELIKELASLRKSLVEETPGERQQVEIALQASKDYLSNIINAIGDPVFVKDDACRFVLANDSLCKILGIERENIIGKTLGESLPANQMKHFLEIDNMVLESGQDDLSEELFTGAGGRILTIVTKKTRYVDEQGNRFIVGTIRDITEHKQAADALQKSEEKYRTLSLIKKAILESPQGIIVFALDKNYCYLDFTSLHQQTMEMIWGVTINQGDNMLECIKNTADREKAQRNFDRALQGEYFLVEEEYGDEMLKRTFYEDRYGPVIDNNGDIMGISVFVIDNTERKLAEKALHVSGEKYKALFNSVSDAIFTFDPVTMEIIEANKATSKLYGYDMDELLGMSCLKLSAEVNKSKAVASAVIKQGLVIVPERHHMRKDGSDLYVELDVYQVKADVEEYVFTVCRDITKRKQAEQERIDLEAQLHQAQKLEAVGTMVGGISHEFNNVLQSMFLYGGMVQDELPENQELRSNFQHILDDGNRARDLIKQILTFSRGTKVEMKPQALHELVMEVLVLERASLSANIEIKQDIDINCGLVLCDKTQIHQIMINLCNNAQHAMQEKGGTLAVSLKQNQASINNGDPETDVLELKVSDTGHGISPTDLERIFDPFFTTKQFGQGTGLGLSVIHGIVEMMDGQISVASELGKGTTFQILFPVTTIAAVQNEVNSPLEVARASRCVLLADDEESIRSVTQIILIRKGYKVDSASDGTQALELFMANPGKYNLIVTDQSMPKMSGVELTQAIRNTKSDIPVILSTGHLGIEEEQGFKDIGITGFIQKPWTAEELIERIQALDHI